MDRAREPGAYDLRIEGGGHVNGTEFRASGAGRGDTRSGELSFDVYFSDLSADTDPLANVFSSLILPSGLFGREVDGAAGLLTVADGEFVFRQRLGGKGGVRAESVGGLHADGEDFVWRSEARGQVPLRDVSEIRPVSVVMIPSGSGRLVETIQWAVVDEGMERTFHAVREFTFRPDREFTGLQLREVSLQPLKRGREVSVQISSTIRPFPFINEIAE